MKKIGIADVCRVLLGLTFLFSGVVKLVDPWGTALKIGEYLNVYGVPSPEGVRFWLAIGFCAAEATLGTVLLLGFARRLAALAALVVMIGFLVVTTLSATFFPVEDCGCFGDALKMSPWASVGKNVVLLALAWIVWRASGDRGWWPRGWRQWAHPAWAAAVSVAFGMMSYLHQPVVDFLPYKVGTDLRAAVDGDGEGDDDILLRQFAIFGPGGVVTHEILNDPGRVYLFCTERIELLGEKCAEKFEILSRRADQEGSRVVILTAGRVPAMMADAYNMDATTMHTMLRAHAGVVTLENGVIVDKRNCRDI